jgi:hypothetical protein
MRRRAECRNHDDDADVVDDGLAVGKRLRHWETKKFI